MKKILIIYGLLNFSFSFSQTTFYQDIYKGGICITGTATGLSSTGFTSLPYYIEPGSSIRKVFLISYEITHATINTNDYNIEINGISYNQNQTDNYLFFSQNLINGNIYTGHRTHISDITNNIAFSGNSLNILMNPQNINQSCLACHYSAPMIVILYENNNLNPINILLAINDKPQNQINFLQINGFNSVNINEQIAMGIHSDRLGGSNNDGYEYFINNLYAGFNNQNDISSIGGGAVGIFYYQNNTLTGLTDDIPNNTLSGSDAIILLNGFVDTDLNPLDVEYEYLQNTNLMHNNLIGLYFAYSSSCSEISAQTSSDTTLCKGSTAQLFASGGIFGGSLPAYEWQPNLGLSCTDCPNPIVTADSSRLYTVRIRNNDSCSVVRPVKVNVRELPAFQSVNPVATACGTETGNVVVVANNTTAKPLSYSLNGGALETSSTFTGEFTELGAGTYTLTLQDAFGCQRDTVFSIASNNTTQAQFTADPQSGAAPLTVSFTNTSTNATNYEWFVTSGSTSTSQGASLSTLTFDTSGVYTVTLVAWQNSSACADTFSVQILVFDTLVLQIPNVFTPNNDGVNDAFNITSNLAASYTFTLLNRWGNVVASKKSTFTPDVPELFWDGKNATDGTYFYTLEVEWENETKKVEGFVVKMGD